jgi:hypothetical protein
MKQLIGPMLSKKAVFTLREQYHRKRRHMLSLTISTNSECDDSISGADIRVPIHLNLIFCFKEPLRRVIAYFDFDLVRSSLQFDITQKKFTILDIHGVRENTSKLGFLGIDELSIVQSAYLPGPRNCAYRHEKYSNRNFDVMSFEEIFSPR